MEQTGCVDERTRADVRDALTSGRQAVDAHVASRARQGHDAKEESLTEILLVTAGDTLRYVEFSRHDEAKVGADWLWWFVDETGECFGLLVQAKRMRIERGRYKISFGYQSGGQSQMDLLLRASTRLGVASAYLLYCGDRAFRGDLTCGPQHSEGTCNTCDRAGVSVLSALCARYLCTGTDPSAVVQLGIRDLERRAFEASVPLEDMADPRPTGLQVHDSNIGTVSTELATFLTTPQVGVRQIAKQFFAPVSEMRSTSLSHAVLAPHPVTTVPLFGPVPPDDGHYGVPYFAHVLRGLRHELPEQVREVLAGQALPAGYETLAGLVLINV